LDIVLLTPHRPWQVLHNTTGVGGAGLAGGGGGGRSSVSPASPPPRPSSPVHGVPRPGNVPGQRRAASPALSSASESARAEREALRAAMGDLCDRLQDISAREASLNGRLLTVLSGLGPGPDGSPPQPLLLQPPSRPQADRREPGPPGPAHAYPWPAARSPPRDALRGGPHAGAGPGPAAGWARPAEPALQLSHRRDCLWPDGPAAAYGGGGGGAGPGSSSFRSVSDTESEREHRWV
jgi:hypothetical protein